MGSLLGNKDILKDFTDSDVDILNGKNTSSNKEIYIFFSFDLVGSTKLKTKEPTCWPSVIFKFYELIYSELNRKIPQVVVWKYLGDEVLLYVSLDEIESDDIIYNIPDIVFNIQLKVSKDIKDVFYSANISEILDIKSTLWIAGVKSIEPKPFTNKELLKDDNTIYKNMKMSLTTGNLLLTDFLGPDMDIGFRISKFAYHHKVTISADFAYLLFRMKKPKKTKNIDDKLKIVSFEILKGVWDNKYYPIIWYYPNWKCVEKDFLYADHKENDIVDRVLSNRIYPINELERIYDELKITDRIEDFIEKCVERNLSKEKRIISSQNS